MTSLSHSRLVECLDYNKSTGIFIWKIRPAHCMHIGDIAGGVNSDGYIQIRVDGPLYKAHRLAWFYVFKVWPKDQLDHINGDRSDNRIENLREANNSQNRANSGCYNKHGLKGIKKHGKKWQARIRHNGKLIHIGTFESKEDAAHAYLIQANNLHGEFARAR